MKLITSMQNYSTIHLGDTLSHPVFGKMRVDCIVKGTSGSDLDVDITCSLLEYNGTIKIFEGIDLIRIKYGRRTRLKVIK